MNQYIIEIILGLIGGTLSGMTGILPIGIILIILNFLGIGTYKGNLGAIQLLNLFPISVGSVWKYYKTNNINYSMALIMIFTTTIGSYIGSLFVVEEKYELSEKTLKYISSFLGFVMGITFYISAQYEKD